MRSKLSSKYNNNGLQRDNRTAANNNGEVMRDNMYNHNTHEYKK